MSKVLNIAIGSGIVLGLGITAYLVKKTVDAVTDPLGVGDEIDKIKDQLAANLKAKQDFIDKLKIDKNSKSELGSSEDAREKQAKLIAIMILKNIKGISDYKQHTLVHAIFKKLQYKNDVKRIIKAFGIIDGQNLYDWIKSESMDTVQQNYILNKLLQSIK